MIPAEHSAVRGVGVAPPGSVVATYLLQGVPDLASAAEALVIEESTGTRHASAEVTARVGGEVLSVESTGLRRVALPSAPLDRAGTTEAEIGVVTVRWPGANATSLPALLTMVAGEASETGTFGACRLIDLRLPADVLDAMHGPGWGVDGLRRSSGVTDRPVLGAIVKPSTGLRPREHAAIAAELAAGGADLVKDDELLMDPSFCPYPERVRATRAAVADVEEAAGRRVLYAPNATGPLDGLEERVELAAAAGCGLVMLNACVLGLEVLRWTAARTGVPILAHRVMAGAFTRSPWVGVAPAVLCGLTRVSGADLVQVGGIGGKIFEDDETVVRNAFVCTSALPGIAPALPLTGGGQSAETVPANAAAFPDADFCHLLGSAATEHPEGPAAGVAGAVRAWTEAMW